MILQKLVLAGFVLCERLTNIDQFLPVVKVIIIRSFTTVSSDLLAHKAVAFGICIEIETVCILLHI